MIMYSPGTIISYKGNTGPVKFSCEYALSFTINEESDKLRQVNVVVYNHSFADITLPFESQSK